MKKTTNKNLTDKYEVAALEGVSQLVKHNDIKVINYPSPGSSGAKVFIIQDYRSGEKYAVKSAIKPRISFIKEKENLLHLKRFIEQHTPQIVMTYESNGIEILISSATGDKTLQNEIEGENYMLAYKYWEDITKKLFDLWSTSRVEEFDIDKNPRHYEKRMQRIYNGIKTLRVNGVLIGEKMDYPTIINGKKFASLNFYLKFISSVDTPKFSVTCHGDPQPTNIVIGKDNWYFVDWEWSGPLHDWRTMFAHTIAWWKCRFFSNTRKPELKVEDGMLVIDYAIKYPKKVNKFVKISNNLFMKMTNKNDFQKDLLDTDKFLAAILFGEVRWREEENIIPLLGMACSFTDELVKNKRHKLYEIQN